MALRTTQIVHWGERMQREREFRMTRQASTRRMPSEWDENTAEIAVRDVRSAARIREDYHE